MLAFVALAAPAPGAPIPRDPPALARVYETTSRELSAAIDAWRASGSHAAPKDVTLYALYQQRIVILLSEKPALSKAVLRRIPHPRPLQNELRSRRELVRLSKPRPLSAFRTGPAESLGCDRYNGVVHPRQFVGIGG